MTLANRPLSQLDLGRISQSERPIVVQGPSSFLLVTTAVTVGAFMGALLVTLSPLMRF